MKVLVTGSSGFIGSRVVAQLKAGGHEVSGVDLRTGQDIRNREQMDAAFYTFCPEAVIHLAARAGVRNSALVPHAFIDTNVSGTQVMLHFAQTYNVKKFILASTSSLYGAHARPVTEDAPTDRPLSPYAVSKKAAELLAYSYHHLYGLNVAILRYFTVYGPHGRPGMAIPRLVDAIHTGRPFTVLGDGSQSRDFTYVEDIARGTVAALQHTGFDVFNLGGGCPRQLMDVIHELERLIGKTAKLEFAKADPSDAQMTWANSGKAWRQLNWKPQVTLAEGLQACVEAYQAELVTT
jgi:UDP-glucuronate 4-epimerase